MDLKEFFKPTKGKIILFILICLFAPLPIYVANPLCPQMLGYECKPYWMFVPFVLTGLAGTSNGPASSLLFITEFWPSLLMNLVISYVISCLILGVYGRYKKQSQGKSF